MRITTTITTTTTTTTATTNTTTVCQETEMNKFHFTRNKISCKHPLSSGKCSEPGTGLSGVNYFSFRLNHI